MIGQLRRHGWRPRLLQQRRHAGQVFDPRTSMGGVVSLTIDILPQTSGGRKSA
jgi:hypothetical protein